jgi:hypothetical protein
MLIEIAILMLTFLYREPLGGVLVHSLDRSETPLTKALLGPFFATPIVLVVYLVLAWRNGYYSIQGRVQYKLVVLGCWLVSYSCKICGG